MMKRIALFALVVAACSSTPTSISLDLTYDPAWQLDGLEVAINDKSSTTTIKSRVRVLVPDRWAGGPVTVAIDGLRDGVPFARGETEVTLTSGGETRATIALEPLAGPACDAAAEDQCTEIPEPTCITGTTLRTATGPGACVDNVCEFPYVDTECTNGCVDGACVCDVVHEGESFPIAVTTVLADRTFKVNDSLVPDTTLNGYGALTLVNAVTGDEIAWGSTYHATYKVSVVAGTYDVYYELVGTGNGAGGAVTVPRNERAKIATVDLTSDETIDLNVTAVKADRTFEVNGVAVPDATANGYGYLYLRTPAGDEISWGATYQGSYPVEVIAGVYDVYYDNQTLGTGGAAPTVPRNNNARIATAITPTATPLALDVTTLQVDRTFKVNGMAVPDSSASGYGELTVRNTATGDIVHWGYTYQSSYRMQLIAGVYDIYYENEAGGTGTGGVVTVPRNTHARIVTGASLTSPTPLGIDVTAVRADRVFKVNGAVLTDTTVNGYGAIYLRHAETGDEVAWGWTYQTSWPTQILSGTYDVVYELSAAGSGAGATTTVPRNTNAIVKPATTITTTTPLEIDVTAVRADRVFEVNGAVPTDTTASGYGALRLRGASEGDEVSWGSTYQPSVPVQIVAGTYDVIYVLTQAGSGAGGVPTVPRNPEARIASAISITSAVPVDLSVEVVRVDRTFTVDGSPVPDTTLNGYGALTLRDLRYPEETAWGSTYQSTYRVPMLAGSYDVMYGLTSSGSGAGGAVVVPRNEHASLGCVEVQP